MVRQCQSLESGVQATATTAGSDDKESGQTSYGALAIPAWSPSTIVGGFVPAAPLGSSTGGKDKEGNLASCIVETPMVTPRESVESPAEPAGLALVGGAAAAAGVNDVATQGVSAARAEECGGAVGGDGGAGRAAAAEALAVGLQAQLKEMKVTMPPTVTILRYRHICCPVLVDRWRMSVYFACFWARGSRSN